MGDANHMVNLEGLERESYLFDSQYYKKLVEEANFTNPTEMTYSGRPIDFRFACINRTYAPCKLWAKFFKPQVEKRTNGKVRVHIASYAELGIAGPDSLEQVTDGTLHWAEITSGYVTGHMPEAELAIMYGVYPDHEIEFKVTQAIGPELDRLFEENTDGGKVLSHMWVSGGDQFLFCKEGITEVADFEGRKVRSHSSALSDWIEGFGADAQFLAFVEVYTALERGRLDCGVTPAFAAHAQRWYEVTDYMAGPLSSQLLNTVIMSREVWDEVPEDIQQILIEEGARHELEAIRVTPAWNEVWIQRNIDAGLEYQEFSPALMDYMRNVVATEHVVPGFIARQDEDNRDNIITLFNERIAPIVGLKTLPDGSVEKESTPAPNPTVSLSMTATVPSGDDLEDEIYVQFSGEASHRMGSSRRENFYETPSIPLKGYHLEAGFLCYIFERVPDDPEYIGWPGWALYFSRERSNGNVGSSGLAYDMRNSGHRDCVAIGHGHGDDRPDRISTVPRYRNFFRVERPEGSWKLTVCTSRVDLTGKVRYVSSSGGMQGWIEKKSFECPPPDG